MDPSGKPRRRPKAAPASPPPDLALDNAQDNTRENERDNDRREKIAKIKKAIEDGTYEVSSEEVARKLIQHMLEPRE